MLGAWLDAREATSCRDSGQNGYSPQNKTLTSAGNDPADDVKAVRRSARGEGWRRRPFRSSSECGTGLSRLDRVCIMARTSGVLLTAARAYKRENRLTELLAVVLKGSPGFTRHLLAEAGLSVEPAECDISTQHRTRRGKYVDLQVLALDVHGHPVARMWSDRDKRVGLLAWPALPGYARELARLPGLGKLITIVASADRPRVPAGDWNVLTWQSVGLSALTVAREASGSAACQDAAAPTASGEARLLYELIAYLEEVHDIRSAAPAIDDPLLGVRVPGAK